MLSSKEPRDKQLVSKYFHHKLRVKSLRPNSQLTLVNMTCGHTKFPHDYWVILRCVLTCDMPKVFEGFTVAFNKGRRSASPTISKVSELVHLLHCPKKLPSTL